MNLGHGDTVGPHDGTSLLERAIDSLLQESGRVVVKSAGNAGKAGMHASGRVLQAGELRLRLKVPAGHVLEDVLDLWYDARDRFAIRLVTPRGYSVEGLDAQTLAFLLRVVG